MRTFWPEVLEKYNNNKIIIRTSSVMMKLSQSIIIGSDELSTSAIKFNKPENCYSVCIKKKLTNCLSTLNFLQAIQNYNKIISMKKSKMRTTYSHFGIKVSPNVDRNLYLRVFLRCK